ncbi:MotA/TolQ/ExbB proton channel family protein [bacterium]|nr:MotA/TolQ/ExbB proton channel family protein [bacterium]MBU1983180.1 MotA/TolQ/ExbB proton channel family protein [bacterium]
MTPGSGSFWELVSIASPFAKFILLILGAMSVASWAIIFNKFFLSGRVRSANQGMIRYRWPKFDPRTLQAEARRYQSSFVARAYLTVQRELFDRSGGVAVDSETIGREFARAITAELNKAERFLPFLATCSSAGPFLGLLGTVWGIISAFQRIGIWGSANIAVVAPGIAEALVATAVGLFAAIPALIAYNFFSSWLRKEAEFAEQFGDDLTHAFDRWLESRGSQGTPNPQRVVGAE